MFFNLLGDGWRRLAFPSGTDLLQECRSVAKKKKGFLPSFEKYVLILRPKISTTDMPDNGFLTDLRKMVQLAGNQVVRSLYIYIYIYIS